VPLKGSLKRHLFQSVKRMLEQLVQIFFKTMHEMLVKMEMSGEGYFKGDNI
jgi:hypothetical protein